MRRAVVIRWNRPARLAKACSTDRERASSRLHRGSRIRTVGITDPVCGQDAVDRVRCHTADPFCNLPRMPSTMGRPSIVPKHRRRWDGGVPASGAHEHEPPCGLIAAPHVKTPSPTPLRAGRAGCLPPGTALAPAASRLRPDRRPASCDGGQGSTTSDNEVRTACRRTGTRRGQRWSSAANGKPSWTADMSGSAIRELEAQYLGHRIRHHRHSPLTASDEMSYALT